MRRRYFVAAVLASILLTAVLLGLAHDAGVIVVRYLRPAS